MNITDTKQQIIDTVRALGRPGTDAVINYLLRSSYFKRGCYRHHLEDGGLATHSLEVYRHMLDHAVGFPSDTIAVVALFHDLGKTRRRGRRGHGRRSVDILDECGYELTAAERTAIETHHDRTVRSYLSPLRLALGEADCLSTRAWKRAHRRAEAKR